GSGTLPRCEARTRRLALREKAGFQGSNAASRRGRAERALEIFGTILIGFAASPQRRDEVTHLRLAQEAAELLRQGFLRGLRPHAQAGPQPSLARGGAGVIDLGLGAIAEAEGLGQ